jgi:hypothetical protein
LAVADTVSVRIDHDARDVESFRHGPLAALRTPAVLSCTILPLLMMAMETPEHAVVGYQLLQIEGRRGCRQH